jgi:heme A synthase
MSIRTFFDLEPLSDGISILFSEQGILSNGMTTVKSNSFAKYAWFTLAYNLVVILWGVFLRASYSGDGCGQHWLTCGGEAIPTAPELKTVIEFSHRITSSLAGLVVLILLVWAFLRKPRQKLITAFAALSFLFILVEGAIGGGLVLTGNTAANWTPTRPYWTAGHLINTFILVAFLTLTAWAAARQKDVHTFVSRRSIILAVTGGFVIFFIGVSGSMAALSTMLFPAESLSQGIAMDLDPSSHPLLRLRIFHPISALIGSVGLIFIASYVRSNSNQTGTLWWSRTMSILVMVQVAFGAVTLLMLAPIVMQLVHLLLAELVWIAFVMMFANHFSASELE